MSQLRVIVDGEPLAEEEARALWTQFSAHMDQHQGDFEGFAASLGFATASVAVAAGTPTLTLRSTTGASTPRTSKGPTSKGPKKTASPKRGRARKGRSGKHQPGRKQAEPDDGRGGAAPPRRKR